MMKKVQKHYSHVASFNAISSHTPKHEYFTSVKTHLIKHCECQIYQKIHFFFIVPFKTQDLEKTRLSIM